MYSACIWEICKYHHNSINYKLRIGRGESVDRFSLFTNYSQNMDFIKHIKHGINVVSYLENGILILNYVRKT